MRLSRNFVNVHTKSVDVYVYMREYRGQCHVHWKSDNISETVLYTAEMLLQHATNRKLYLYAASLIAVVVMTLSVLEVHSRIASLFKCDISYF